MTAASWDQLPLRVRNEVLWHVESMTRTLRGKHSVRRRAELEDTVRFAVDALLRNDVITDAYYDGYEDGRQAGLEERSAGAA